MDVGPPERLAEHVELLVGPEVARELVDGQVEAHPVADAVDRRKAQAGGRHAVVVTLEQALLHGDLLLRVERHRAQLAGLVDRDGRVGHAAVVRACGGEQEALHAGFARLGDQVRGPLDVDRVGQLGVAPAGGIAHDRGQMDHGVHAREGGLARLGVAHVAALQVDAQGLEPRGHVLLLVQQHVQRAHLVPGGQQLVDQLSADVAGASGYQHLHQALPVCGSRSGRNIGRSCSNSINAFS